MTKYVVLLPGIEDAWEQATAEQRAEVYARHEEFVRLLAERGHGDVGGAELTHSRTTKQVRKDASGRVLVTEGPFAETAEQLTGFYTVETDDLDDLIQLSAMLAGDSLEGYADMPVEIRAAVDHSGDAG